MTSRGFDVIGTDECIKMLGDHTFGRVGMKIADEPVILPVFYTLVGGEVVFRTDPGTKLIAAVLETRVAFEVDDAADGWSVLVVGRAHEMRSGSSDTASAHDRLENYWPSGERDRVVRIEIEKVTGRRLHRSA